MADLELLWNAPAIEAYGMTEAAHQIASNPLPPGRRCPGSVGLPTGAEILILDESGNPLEPGSDGEIAIRGPNVCAGYCDPEANEAAFVNGWLKTGDQGFVDEDGYVTISGRLKELINRGGEKIAPREIDEALESHPAVAVAVAYAIPDPRLGEVPGAAVVLHEAASVEADELVSFASQRLARFKVPRTIAIVDELPLGPSGKPLRSSLAKELAAREEETPGLGGD